MGGVDSWPAFEGSGKLSSVVLLIFFLLSSQALLLKVFQVLAGRLSPYASLYTKDGLNNSHPIGILSR
jgi:hypothetical protein